MCLSSNVDASDTRLFMNLVALLQTFGWSCLAVKEQKMPVSCGGCSTLVPVTVRQAYLLNDLICRSSAASRHPGSHDIRACKKGRGSLLAYSLERSHLVDVQHALMLITILRRQFKSHFIYLMLIPDFSLTARVRSLVTAGRLVKTSCIHKG
jgi:hypothetical protein